MSCGTVHIHILWHGVEGMCGAGRGRAGGGGGGTGGEGLERRGAPVMIMSTSAATIQRVSPMEAPDSSSTSSSSRGVVTNPAHPRVVIPW